MVERRQTIKRLPVVHQTETLQRFFSATVDHLFQPHASEQLSGYIGRRPLYVNPEEDFYLQEPDETRQAYSLEPLMISTATTGTTLRNALFYDDLINNLRFQGGRTSDHNRLFETEYYSWSPPLDLDMLCNPGEYYWVADGPDPIALLSPTDVTVEIVGSRKTPLLYRGLYRLPADKATAPPRDGTTEPLSLSSGMSLLITDDAEPSYDDKVFILDGVGRGAVLTEEVPRDTNIGWDYIGFEDVSLVAFIPSLPGQPVGAAIEALAGQIEGQPTYAWSGWYKRFGDAEPTKHDRTPDTLGSLSRQTSRPIGLTDQMGFLVAEVPSLDATGMAASVRAFRVSGVGRAIELTPVRVGWNSTHWDAANAADSDRSIPDYIVMERGCRDQNDWSRNNRWFHREVLKGQKKTMIRAARPVLQFRRDLELFNYGDTPLGSVDVAESVLAYDDIAGFAARDPDFLQPYDHLRDFGVAPLLLDSDPATKQAISVYDATATLPPDAAGVDAGQPFTATASRMPVEQLARSVVYSSLGDGSYGLLIRGVDYTVVGQTIEVVAARTANPVLKVIYWDTEKGVLIRDGMTVLLTGDPNEVYNNQIYRVDGIKATGRVNLTRITAGSGPDGSPGAGDLLRVRSGYRTAAKSLAFNGLNWVVSQSKDGLNQEPLFQLYDIDGVRLQDDGRYPGSDFRGNPLFAYGVSDSVSVPVDPVLFKRVRYRDVGLRAEMVFVNHLNRSVETNRASYDGGPITGYYFHRTKERDDLGTTERFDNDWHRAAGPAKQYITHTEFGHQGQTEIETAYRFTLRQSKTPARVVATSSIALPREPVPLDRPLVIDGVTLADGDRVLAVAQDNPVENGLYEIEINPDPDPVQQGEATVHLYFRALDANADDSVNEGTFVAILEGETGRRTAWAQTTPDPVIPDRTAMLWRQIDGPRPFPQPIVVIRNNVEAVLGQDYDVTDGVIRFAEPLVKNEVIRIRVYAGRSPDREIGAYEIPLNLQANPDWDEIDEFTQAEFREHLRGIIGAQRDLVGRPVAANNWRDTEQDLSYGTVIVQHRSPLLKTMLLSSSRDIDFILACQHAEREYTRFRNKLQRMLLEFYEDRNTRPMEPAELLDRVLDQLALGRTADFAFAHSDMVPGGRSALVLNRTFAAASGQSRYAIPSATSLSGDEIGRVFVYLNRHDGTSLTGERLLVRNIDYRIDTDEIVLLRSFGLGGQDRISVRFYRDYLTFVPPSPAHLGLRPIQQPVLAVDQTLLNPRAFVMAHDGVFIDAFADEYAVLNEALLEFERRVYNATDPKLTDREAVPVFDHRSYVAAKFRRAADYDRLPTSARSPQRADYEQAEWVEITRPMFQRWSTLSGIDYRQNLTYAQNNPWTWNYRGLADRDGDPMPGHWRAIYKFYYDTDRPHSHPWEMLGFSQQPSWWEQYYGVPPYNRSNTILWDDLEHGIVRDGPNRGVRPQFVRPGLSRTLPVDETGRLLDPVAAGIMARRPTPTEASRPWAYGDHGPAETTWIRHSLHGFAVVQAQYLTKPSTFLETTWDTTRITEVFRDDPRSRQWVYSDTRDRPRHADLRVHGETVDGVTHRATGSQQILSDFIMSTGQSITETLGDALRGLGVKLGHKMAGFVDADTLQVRADNFGNLPRENVNLLLYRSPSVAEHAYSGVIIEWTGRRWRVLGYDGVTPSFRTIPHDLNGDRAPVSVGGGGTPALPPPPWRPTVYYPVGVTVVYETATFKAAKSHQSGHEFDPAYWTLIDGGDTPPGIQVTYYKTANRAGRVVEVPYGSEFRTQQEVFDFLISYGRWLESQGWAFEDTVEETGDIRDWLSVGKDFLFWSLARWQPGTSIALSPAAKLVTFRRPHGEVQSVEQIVQGVYSILGRDGTMISPRSTTVSRSGGEMTITPRNASLIFATRLFVSEVEHVLIFDNETIFGDLIYSPLLNLRQPRLKLHVARSADWTGRIDAPGFVVSDNVINARPSTTLFANFEKTTTDFRRYYNIEDAVEAPILRDHARHLVGYQQRDYLSSLLLDPTVQYEFYLGMIHGKGTTNGMRAMLRNLFVTEAEEIRFHDEWMFRLGSYGGLTNDLTMEFELLAGDIKQNPQAVEFRASPLGIDDSPSDSIINLALSPVRDPRWVIPPSDAIPTPFPIRRMDQHLDNIPAYQPLTTYGAGDIVKFNDLYFGCIEPTIDPVKKTPKPFLAPAGSATIAGFDAEIRQGRWRAIKEQPGWLPTAGYWRYDEIEHFARDYPDLVTVGQDLIDADQTLFAPGSHTAVYDTGAGHWMVFRTSRLNPTTGVRIVTVDDDDTNVEQSRVTTDLVHGRQIGDWIIVSGDSGSRPDLMGVHRVVAVPDPLTLVLDWSTTEAYDWRDDQDGDQGPEILVFHPVRFAHHTEVSVAAKSPPDGWQIGDYAFLDSGETAAGTPTPGFWSVRRLTGTDAWTHVRSETPKVDAARIRQGLVYDRGSNRISARLIHHDPIKGVLPGLAERELWYKLEFDPAKYSHGDAADLDPEQAWGPTEVGRLWWDLSTVRFLDYEIADFGGTPDREVLDYSYRRAMWGRLAPRSAVEIYEWVRSPVPPSQWAGWVEANAQVPDESIDYKPSGEARTGDGTGWVERIEYNPTADTYTRFYYFWVRNPTSLPRQDFRSLPASEVGRMITDPKAAGLAMFAPISPDAVIVANTETVLDDDSIVQIRYQREDRDDNVHRQWLLMREGDDANPPDESLWSKLRDSLIGFDALGRPVPDPALSEASRYGNEFRPRQTWFIGEADGRPSRMARRIFIDKLNGLLAEVPMYQREGVEGVLSSSDAAVLRQTTKPLKANLIQAAEGHTPRIIPATLVSAAEQTAVSADTDEIDGARIRPASARSTDTILLVDQTTLPNGLYTAVRVPGSGQAADTITYTPVALLLATGDIIEITEGTSRRGSRWIWSAGDANAFEMVEPTEYHREVETVAERDALMDDLDVPAEPGEQILVHRHPTAALQWWSIWQYRGSREWVLTAMQRFRMEDIWEPLDWFADGYTAAQMPQHVFASELDRDIHARVTGFAVGDLIEIRPESGRFVRQEALGDNRYKLVGQAGGSVRFSDRLYRDGTSVLPPLVYSEAAALSPPGSLRVTGGLLDQTLLDRVATRDGSLEFGVLFDHAAKLLTAGERNLLFFACVHYAHVQHLSVDWAAKSSLMVVKGINEPLEQRPILMPDRIGPLFDFIGEVKPFHTKIRDFTLSLITRDTFNVRVTDFDKPVYPMDRTQENTTIGVEFNPDGTLAIAAPYTATHFSDSRQHQDWWAEFLTSDGSPVRSPRISLHFDRVSWIDWTVEGSKAFLNLYNAHYRTTRTWGSERALVPGHRVLWKNYDGLSISHWRVYRMVRPNPLATYVAAVTPVTGGVEVRTDQPHGLTPEGYVAGIEVHYLTLALSLPAWATPATGRHLTYTMSTRIKPDDVRVAVGATYLSQGTDYTLEDGDATQGYLKIRFKAKPLDGLIQVFTPSLTNMRGTHKILRWVDAHRIVIDAKLPVTLDPAKAFSGKTVGTEVYGWSPEGFTTQDGVTGYLDHTVDPTLLTQAERVSLYYRPGDGMPENNNRQILGAEFKGTRFDGDALAAVNPDFPGSLSWVYREGHPAKIPLMPSWFTGVRRPDLESLRVSLNGDPLPGPFATPAWDAVQSAWILTLDPAGDPAFRHGDVITVEILPDWSNTATTAAVVGQSRDLDLIGGSFAATPGGSALLVEGGLRLPGPVETFTPSTGQRTFWLSNVPALGVVEGIHHAAGRPVAVDDPDAATLSHPEFDWLVRVSVGGRLWSPDPKVVPSGDPDFVAEAYDLIYDKGSSRWGLVLASVPAADQQVRVEFIGRTTFRNPYLDQDRPQELIPMGARDSLTLNVLQAPFPANPERYDFRVSPRIYSVRTVVDRPQTRFPLHRLPVSAASKVLVGVSDPGGANGRLLGGSTFTVQPADNEVVLNAAPPAGAEVKITVIEPSEHNLLTLRDETLTTLSGHTLPEDGYTDPAFATLIRHAALLVWHKGSGDTSYRRLQPPRTTYWIGDGFTTSFPLGHAVSSPTQSYVLRQADREAVPTKLVNGTDYTIAASGTPAVTRVTFTQAPAAGLLLTFVSKDPGDFDYWVNPQGKLVLSATTKAGRSVAVGHSIKILSFGRSDLSGIRTEVFSPRPDYRYVLSQQPWNTDALWVDIDGDRQVYGIDYGFERTDTGYDTRPHDIEGWDPLDRFPVLVLYKETAATARIVVTTLANPQAAPVVGFSIHHDGILAETSYRRSSDWHTTRLTADLRTLDTELVVQDASRFLTEGSYSGVIGISNRQDLTGSQQIRFAIPAASFSLSVSIEAGSDNAGKIAKAFNEAVVAAPSLLDTYGIIRAEADPLGYLRIVGPRTLVFTLADVTGTSVRSHFGLSPVTSRTYLDETGVVSLPSGERIEYREIDLSIPGKHRLLRVKRSAQGTARGVPNIYETALVAGVPDGVRKSFTAAFTVPVRELGIMVRTVDAGGLTIREYHRNEFTLSVAGRVITITFNQAPEADLTVRVSATVSNWLDGVNPIQHTAGACVIDRGPLQRIPGGFAWETDLFPTLTYDGTTLEYVIQGVPDLHRNWLVLDKDDGSRQVLQQGTHYQIEHDAATNRTRLILPVHTVKHQSRLGTAVIGRPAAGKTWKIRGAAKAYYGLQASGTPLSRFLLESPGGLGCGDLPPPEDPPDPPNLPPVWITPQGSLATVTSGDPVTLTVLAIDPEGVPVTYSVIGGPLPHGWVLQADTGGITGTAPTVATDTTVTFTLRAGDGLLFTDREFSITVQNQGPVWVTPAGTIATVASGATVEATLLATDPDGQTVSYSVVGGSLPAGMVLQGSTGVVSGTAAVVVTDTTTAFTVRVSDGDLFADREFSITVLAAEEETCVPVYGLATVGTLPAAELAHAVADDGTAPYYESRPEFHVVNPATRTVLIPSMAEDANGDYQMLIFTEHLDTGVRGVIDPYADWATKPDMSGQLIHFMLDPYTQDLWWTIYNRSDSHVYVARASEGYKVTLQPAVMADAGGYTTGYYWRLIGFTPTMAIFAFIDDMSVLDTTWGIYLTVFSKDFSQYGGANQTLTPSGRQKVVHQNDKVSPAFDKHGDLWLLADIRTNDNVNPKPYPGKLRLLRWQPPSLGPIPFGQAMPTLTGVLTDMTPATGWDTTVEVGVSTNPNQPDFPYLYYNEDTDSLLVTVGQGNASTSLSVPRVINNFPGGPYTQSYWQSNVVRYDIATGTLTALTRHDGLLDANKLPVASVGEATFIVTEWFTTDPHHSRSFQPDRADSTWIWTTYNTLVDGTVRSNFTDGTGSETIGFFERRSLADWSLLDRVDTRTTLNLLPEAGGQNVYFLMDPWTEGPWENNQYVAENIHWITWLPDHEALLIRYDYGSVPLDDGLAYVNGHERLLKITLKPCPPE